MRIITIIINSGTGPMIVLKHPIVIAVLLTAGLALGAESVAAQEEDVQVVIRDHKFVPAEVTVTAGKKFKLIVENQDATAEEFDSYELNREKVVPAKGRITIFIGPLAPGRYPFFGDYHKDTAKGVLIAK